MSVSGVCRREERDGEDVVVEGDGEGGAKKSPTEEPDDIKRERRKETKQRNDIKKNNQ